MKIKSKQMSIPKERWKKTNPTQANVYDIGLEGPHNFMIEGGIFASNCFNKSHSISYSFITYITAYLKANYPLEFFCALMTTRSKSLQPKDWAQKAPQFINEAKAMNVNINAPSVNGSNLEFTIKDGEIYFGLNAIRDVGKTAAKSIVSARSKRPFRDVFDFVSRVNTQKVNTRTFVSLVRAGAFDKMGYDRLDLESKADALYKYFKSAEEHELRLLEIEERNSYNAKVIPLIEQRNELRKLVKKHQRKIDSGKQEISLLDFEKMKRNLEDLESQNLKKKVSLKQKQIDPKPEFLRNKNVKLGFKEIVQQANYIGCYTDIHPVNLINTGCESISSLHKGEFGVVAAVVSGYKSIKTRKGKMMAFMELDDSNVIAESVIFPHTYTKEINGNDIEIGTLVKVAVKKESDEPPKLIVNKIFIYEE